MRCFFCKNLDEEFAVLDKAESNHLFKVLRAVPGTMILLNDGKGTLAEAELQENKIIRITNKRVFVFPEIRIHLFVAVPRKNKMDMLLSQCTEAGVWAIYPIITERNVAVPNKENTDLKWRDKLIEACKQSRNPFIPTISIPVTLKKAIDIVNDKEMTAYFGGIPGLDKNSGSICCKRDVAWFVGPEGGFSEEEISLMKKNSFTSISIGKYVMRVETAALAGVILLQN